MLCAKTKSPVFSLNPSALKYTDPIVLLRLLCMFSFILVTTTYSCTMYVPINHALLLLSFILVTTTYSCTIYVPINHCSFIIIFHSCYDYIFMYYLCSYQPLLFYYYLSFFLRLHIHVLSMFLSTTALLLLSFILVTTTYSCTIYVPINHCSLSLFLSSSVVS